MKWHKIGNVFPPIGRRTWLKSHAGNPFAWHIKDSLYRVFFTSRDANNRSHISSAIVDFNADFKILEVSEHPILAPGELGLFDDSGVMMGYLLEKGDKLYLYYLGWNLKVTVPWLNTIGLAISEDGGETFQKYSRAPIMDRSDNDPFSISYPSILFEDNSYRMWYGSNLGWGSDQSDMMHVIKSASSDDAIHWTTNNRTAIPLKNEFEYALSKPFVLKENGTYYMWYSFRASKLSNKYRIGVAASVDGQVWERMDEKVGIEPSKSGWDSEMIEYPWIGKHDDHYIMLYNGNEYGRTGFGAAITNDIKLK